MKRIPMARTKKSEVGYHILLCQIFFNVVIMYILLYKQLCKILKHLGIATVHNSHYQRYLPMRVTNAPGKVPTDQYHCRHTTLGSHHSSSQPSIKLVRNEKNKAPVRRPSPPIQSTRPKADRETGTRSSPLSNTASLLREQPPRLRAERESKVSLSGSEDRSHQPGWNLWLS